MRSTILRAFALALLTTVGATSVAGAAAPVGTASAQAAAPSAVGPAATRAFDTFQDIPVRGSTESGGSFRGTLDIVRFRAIEGQVYAIGDLTGRVLDSNGDLVGKVSDKRVRLPLAANGTALSTAAAPTATSCDVLNLTLGPLDLDLLGLQVHLDRVVLNITAEPGPGNLLGNLLCAITGLLDAGSPLSGVLAQLLTLLRGLVTLFG